MKDYRNYYGQSIPALHGKGLQTIIARIKKSGFDTSKECIHIEQIGGLSTRDALFIGSIFEQNKVNYSLSTEGEKYCSLGDEYCSCDNIKGAKIGLIYSNLESSQSKLSDTIEVIKSNQAKYIDSFLVLSCVKENNPTELELSSYGFESIEYLPSKDNTLFVHVGKFVGNNSNKSFATKKKENKKEAPLNSEENFNNGNSE